MSTTVTTQAELDAAIKRGDLDIIIRSPAGVVITVAGSSTVSASDSSRVYASGSSTVYASNSSRVYASGSSTVYAYGSSTVYAYGSSTVSASGSSTVSASNSSTVYASDSSRVYASNSSTVYAYGSSTVYAYGSSTVSASDSSTVSAGNYVAVHLHSQRVKLKGGVVLDMTAIDETDPATWCDLHGVTVKRGKATLYKALDENYQAGHSYQLTTYTVGSTVTAPDWREGNDCGGGLHLGPTPTHATAYRHDAKRWVACEVKVTDLRPILGGTAKCKVKSCKVVREVDAFGREVKP